MIDLTESNEGRVTWMYQDNKGVVSCGVGHAMFTVDQAVALPWDHPVLQVRADYAAVRAAPSGYRAEWYAHLTKSRLSQEAVDALKEADIEREVGLLKLAFPFFDTYPETARAALQDMAFNLGGGFPREWPKFTACVLAMDWVGAAENCHRAPPVSEERNKRTADLFRQAVNASS